MTPSFLRMLHHMKSSCTRCAYRPQGQTRAVGHPPAGVTLHLGLFNYKRTPTHLRLLFEGDMSIKLGAPSPGPIRGSPDGGTDLLLAGAKQEGREGGRLDYPCFADAETEAPSVSRQHGEGLGRSPPHPKSALRRCSKQV